MTEKRGPGSLPINFRGGNRSEYLAQFVFSAFGTAIPVPHQEDTGLDIYCTLLQQEGRRAWPRAYYSVQVKSTMDPWEFNGRNSVRWFIEHPLPIFLCIVQKAEAKILPGVARTAFSRFHKSPGDRGGRRCTQRSRGAADDDDIRVASHHTSQD